MRLLSTMVWAAVVLCIVGTMTLAIPYLFPVWAIMLYLGVKPFAAALGAVLIPHVRAMQGEMPTSTDGDLWLVENIEDE